MKDKGRSLILGGIMKRASMLFPLFLACLFLASCGPSEPGEVRINNAIEAMARAVEEGEPESFLARVAEDFTGHGGRWDRQRVRQYILARTLQRGERPDIDLDGISIELLGDRARATVEVRISNADRWLPRRGAHYRFETGWRVDGGEWRIIRADWERLGR
jgi:hypothetical protein